MAHPPVGFVRKSGFAPLPYPEAGGAIDELRPLLNVGGAGGFVWWGTRAALASRIINEIEIPAALDRASAEPQYPFVPVFVDLGPTKDHKEIVGALGDRAEEFLSRNGVIRGSSESADAFRRDAPQHIT